MKSPTSLKQRIAPSVPLTLNLVDDDGNSSVYNFRLSYDFNAIALVEEKTGHSMLQGEIWNNLSAKTLSILFWAGVQAHHPEYDGEPGLRAIRSYMDAGNAPEVTEAINAAFIASLSKDKQEAIKAAQDGNPTTGVV